jgi:hypothetical protein
MFIVMRCRTADLVVCRVIGLFSSQQEAEEYLAELRPHEWDVTYTVDHCEVGEKKQ